MLYPYYDIETFPLRRLDGLRPRVLLCFQACPSLLHLKNETVDKLFISLGLEASVTPV